MKITFLQLTISILFFASILQFNTAVKGQSNPIPFDLSAEPYEFSAWDSLSPKGTFPESLVFHYVAANQTSPFYDDATSDYDCSYHKSKRPRINGLMNQGIGIVTTSSSQYNDCDAGAADNRFMGAVILALNATERNNIRMRWKSETVTPADGNGVPTDPRVWNLRLQYRLGNSGLFNDFPGPVEFISSTATGDSVQFGPLTLPSVCNNQPVIQLRWIYFESSAGVGGSRPQLRLDDIEVTSDQTVGIIENQTTADGAFTIFPNPAHGQFSLKAKLNSEGNIMVTDQAGRQVMLETFNQPLTTFNCTALPEGIYFVKVTYLPDGQFSTKKLLIQ